jgi:hypothetical protein
MAIDLTTDPEGLFPRLGKLGKILFKVNGDQSDLSTVFGEIALQYATSLHDRYGVLAQAQTGLIRNQSGIVGAVQSLAVNTVIDMVEADQPAAARSLPDAINEVIRQMNAAMTPETVQVATVSVSIAALGTPIGTGVFVSSTKRGDGLIQENMFAEVGRIICTGDSYQDGQTAGQEPFTYVGESDLGVGVLDYNWPQGSSANTQLRAISADEDGNSDGNLLTNGDAEDWSDDPDPELENWVLTVATWGTEIEQSATGFRGSFALRFIASTTNTVLSQQFNDTDGTAAIVKPLTSYAVNLWARKVTGTISAGVLTVELVDGSGTTINDEQGTANSFTIDLTALTTSYVAKNGVFRLPAVMPSEVHLRLRISTDLAGNDFLVDDICMTPLTAAYTGGPGLAVFSGSTPFVKTDTWTVTGANNRGGATFLASFQALFDRLFNTRQLGILLPSDASPTIADTLITA